MNFPELSRWTGLLVKGNRISLNQAKHVIIRTADWDISSNNTEYENDVYSFIYDIPREELGDYETFPSEYLARTYPPDSPYFDYYSKLKTFDESIANLSDILYLCNERVTSSWIGGVHGWYDDAWSYYCDNSV